jgi:molecular chaperone GrpE
MDELSDGKEMDENRPQPPGTPDYADHRGRGRRREGAAPKHQTHTGAQGDNRSQPGSASSLIGSLGDINLTDSQLAALETAVQQRLADEQAKTEDAEERLLRTQADFANYKRRNDQEREQQARFATMMLVAELLPVLDNLDRALSTVPENVSRLPWMEGLLLVDRQLRATLEKQGLQPINALGTHFDPMQHEAIIHEESTEHEDDEVIAELRRGYMLHDKVVRPTLVKVAKRVEPAVSTTEEN